MTKVQKAGLGLLMLVAIGLLGLVFTYIFRDDAPSDTEILESAQREKQAVLGQIAEGKILYLKFEEYKRDDPSIPPGAWVEGTWNLLERQLERGWTYVGHGELNGERSVIFENQ